MADLAVMEQLVSSQLLESGAAGYWSLAQPVTGVWHSRLLESGTAGYWSLEQPVIRVRHSGLLLLFF